MFKFFLLICPGHYGTCDRFFSWFQFIPGMWPVKALAHGLIYPGTFSPKGVIELVYSGTLFSEGPPFWRRI